MNQTVNAVNNFSKCAKRHQLNDFDRSYISNLIGIGKHLPRICFRIFVSKRNSSLLFIKTKNININFITDVQNFGRLFYTLPAEFGYVNHSVDAANVDKSTVRSHALNSSVIFLADLNVVPDCFSSSLALALQNSADRADNTFAAFIHFGNDQANRGANHTAQISLSGLSGLGCGNKYSCTLDVNDNATLVNFSYIAFNNFAGFLSCFDNGPALCSIQTTFGKGHSSLYVIDAGNDCFNRITNFDNILNVIAVIGKFRSRNKSGILDAKINVYIHRSNGSNYTRNQIAIANRLERLFQHFIEGQFLLACFFCRLCCNFFSSLFCNRSFHSFLFSSHFYFGDFLYCFLCLWDLFSFDLFTHRINYLLDYPRGCRRSSCDSDSFGSC